MQKILLFALTIPFPRGAVNAVKSHLTIAHKNLTIRYCKKTKKGHKAGRILLKRAGGRCEPAKEACDLTPESSA